jgi:DNA-directed RNA polymerase subunit RPC12/RpoP
MSASFIGRISCWNHNKGRGSMLAICEDCSKKYNIDESKMKGERARFSCQECGHIIVVVKRGATVQSGEKSGAPGTNASGR